MLASFITFSMLPLTVDTFAEVLWHKVKGFGWGGGGGGCMCVCLFFCCWLWVHRLIECQYSYFKLCFVRMNQFSAMILPANNQ